MKCCPIQQKKQCVQPLRRGPIQYIQFFEAKDPNYSPKNVHRCPSTTASAIKGQPRTSAKPGKKLDDMSLLFVPCMEEVNRTYNIAGAVNLPNALAQSAFAPTCVTGYLSNGWGSNDLMVWRARWTMESGRLCAGLTIGAVKRAMRGMMVLAFILILRFFDWRGWGGLFNWLSRGGYM